jgi:hypothetical protein
MLFGCIQDSVNLSSFDIPGKQNCLKINKYIETIGGKYVYKKF